MPANTRVPCSRETRAWLSEHKKSPETYDDVLRKLIRAYEIEDKE